MSGETAGNQHDEQVSPLEVDSPQQAQDEAAEESTAAADTDHSVVPEKQVHRWKDDGGAVIFD